MLTTPALAMETPLARLARVKSSGVMRTLQLVNLSTFHKKTLKTTPILEGAGVNLKLLNSPRLTVSI
jgi:hypothetical protein